MPRARPCLLLLCLLLSACFGVTDFEDDDNELYEDDAPFLDPKANNLGLSPKTWIASYVPISEAHILGAKRLLLIRSYLADGVPMYVSVNVDDNTLEPVAADTLTQDTQVSMETIGDSPYLLGLSETSNSTLSTLHHEATQAPGDQFSLTVDMCQSSRVWDLDLFRWMVDLSSVTGEPTRVGIAMTGLWAARHSHNFQQLLDWQRDGKLDITWINHSNRHQLSKDSRGKYHFLTKASIDFEKAVTDLEILLLSQDQMFSPLFRFPGLVHDSHRLRQLNGLSLLGLDANGWLAKGQPLADGSVVLLHGNGNETVGVRMFFEAIFGREAELASGKLQLVSPTQALPVLP